ncbi:MAG: sodium:proton antiporter, partial [Candidatus Promineofilum sp.]|nr:sodium:proton antiporter [Promineifilum sp.]
MHEALTQLALVAVVGLGAQLIAWHLRLPSILLLLVSGFLLGPVFGLITPNTLLGDTLFPFVSLSVGIILFEGGLTLKLKELPASGPVVSRLISVGPLATWVVAALGARYLLGFDWPLAILIGAILIVTGPTVVGPLLRQIRPKGRAGTILKWEGILIDPVGAVLAVLVFEMIALGGGVSVPGFVLLGVGRSLLVGVVLGLLGAAVLVALMRRHLIPDYLQSGVTLMLVVGFFTLGDLLAAEGGLLTVTLMGIALANQTYVPVRHIVEFKENLQVLLIGVLFILLAGRVQIDNLLRVGWPALGFIVLLIGVARPLSVMLSTWRTPLTRAERLFLMWMAPRGIVAASVASVFAFELSELGVPNAELLSPLVFLVIVGTVIFYGLTSGPVARWLGLAEREPQGALIIGAHAFARQLAALLGQQGLRAVLVDTNYHHVSESRLLGLEVYHGSALAEETLDSIDLAGLGRVLALTGNDEINVLSMIHFREVFGGSEVYRLPAADKRRPDGLHQGRTLFGSGVHYEMLDSVLDDGATLEATQLNPSFTFADFKARYGQQAIPLCFVAESGRLSFYTTDNQPTPRPDQCLI